MERLKMEYNFIPFHLLLFITLLLGFNATVINCTQLTSNPLKDAVCAVINCGQGVCKASDASLLGFDCECNPGWKKIQIGPLTSSCVLPNCTIDFQCGKGSLPPSPPPPIALPPPQNLSSPCALVWCGDGACITNGTGYTCQCFEGSENFMDLKGLPCFKQCSLGADCNGLNLVPSTTSPPPPPPQANGSTSRSHRIGSTGLWNCLRNLHAVLTMMILLAAIFEHGLT